jgi:multidrug transporter EmrE-like cation transporter
MHWLYLSIAILAEVVATSSLKAAEGFTRLTPSLIVVFGYGTAFYFLSLALRTMQVGTAYAIWSGVGTVIISIVAWLFYNQKLDAPSILGMALIIIGVIIIKSLSPQG